MKVGINPLWEDPRNKQGGAFSYRITNKYVFETFRDLLYVLIGETLTSSDSFNRNICGITLSPKKNFCVVKVWMQNKDFQKVYESISQYLSLSKEWSDASLRYFLNER